MSLRSRTATTSARSTSASRAASSSRSPPSRPASPPTKIPNISASSSASRKCTSASMRASSRRSRRSSTRGRASAWRHRTVAPLSYRERPAGGDPAGLLVLHHGRGADEADLLTLADQLDPERRLHVVAPRAPLTLGGPGYHWYVVPRVGYPDHDTFHTAYKRLSNSTTRSGSAPG